MYFVKNPAWLRLLYPNCVWKINTAERVLYLTFDDGPSKETDFVLQQLTSYHAKATFFCLGQNVVQHRSLFQELISEKHSVGNHTWAHLNGWKTMKELYLEDIKRASGVIPSKLFRPPYGRISHKQIDGVKQQGFKILMWSVLSADFDKRISPEKCYKNVAMNAFPGAIVLFHDAIHSAANLRYALPRVLDVFSERGYRFEAITEDV